jgi:hypothetical protein
MFYIRVRVVIGRYMDDPRVNRLNSGLRIRKERTLKSNNSF